MRPANNAFSQGNDSSNPPTGPVDVPRRTEHLQQHAERLLVAGGAPNAVVGARDRNHNGRGGHSRVSSRGITISTVFVRPAEFLWLLIVHNGCIASIERVVEFVRFSMSISPKLPPRTKS